MSPVRTAQDHETQHPPLLLPAPSIPRVWLTGLVQCLFPFPGLCKSGPTALPRGESLIWGQWVLVHSTSEPVTACVPPARAAGSHSPAAGATSQLAGCPSAAGPRSPAAETSEGRSSA